MKSRFGPDRHLASIVLAIGALALLTMWSLWPAPALAHTDLIATRPSDGEAIGEPVTRIELEFSGALDSGGTSVRVLDADGGVVPVEVTHVSDERVVIEPEDDLDGGRFAVLWEARSASDGHEISGSFSFDVLTGADASTDVDSDNDPPPADGAADEAGPATEDTEPQTAPTTTESPVATTIAARAADEAGADMTPEVSGENPSDLVGAVGRWVSLLGTLVAIGATAFAAFALIGTRSEIGRVVGWIRAAGVALVVGTVLEVAATAVAASGVAVLIDPVGILDALPTSSAYAAVLRIAGGIALLQSPALITTSHRIPDLAHVAPGTDAAAPDPPEPGDDSRRLIVREEWLILAGLAAITASYLIDGHSATLGIAGRAANLVHVIAGGVWLGGVIVLGDLTVRRVRRGAPTRFAKSVVRFSRVATVALIAVAIAGSLLAWSIVDDPADLVSGSWGRLLIGKVALVAVAAGIGAYNHFRVVPTLQDDPERVTTLARTLTAEAIVLVFVVAVTAALVVSAT